MNHARRGLTLHSLLLIIDAFHVGSTHEAKQRIALREDLQHQRRTQIIKRLCRVRREQTNRPRDLHKLRNDWHHQHPLAAIFNFACPTKRDREQNGRGRVHVGANLGPSRPPRGLAADVRGPPVCGGRGGQARQGRTSSPFSDMLM